MHKVFHTKKGQKIEVSIEKTTIKEKVQFVVSALIVGGLVWYFFLK